MNEEIYSITYIYRKIILNFLKKFNNNEYEFILDDLLLTNKYYKALINTNYNINKKNIKEFKHILIRIIISDIYLQIKSLEKDEELDKYLNNIKSEYLNVNNEFKEESLLNNMDINILNFIEKYNYFLPNIKEYRLYIYTKFIIYNNFFNEHTYDLENIIDDKNTIKKLEKINPCYFLDYLN